MITRPLIFFLSHRITRDGSGRRSGRSRMRTYVSPPTPLWLALRRLLFVVSHFFSLRPLLSPSHPRPPPLPSPIMHKGPLPHPVCAFFSLLGSRSGTQSTLSCLVQRRSHESAKKATLRIRFVIVGGGPAGLACAVALRRVGHHVIVLEKGPDFIGVRTTPVPFKLAP
jgi:NAD(P)-binding Rossmann-like domain